MQKNKMSKYLYGAYILADKTDFGYYVVDAKLWDFKTKEEILCVLNDIVGKFYNSTKELRDEVFKSVDSTSVEFIVDID